MFNIIISLLIASASAVDYFGRPWGDGVFNASGFAPMHGYNLSVSSAIPSRWTIEERITHNEQAETLWHNMALKEDGHQIANIADGWHLCHAYSMVKRRTSTAPIPSDCQGILSSDCIRRLQAMRYDYKSDEFCDLSQIMKACDFKEATGFFTNSEELKKETDSIWYAGGLGGFYEWNPEQLIPDYDEWMTTVFVSTVMWAREGIPDDQQLNTTVACLGIDFVSTGSRDLQTAIGTTGQFSPMFLYLAVGIVAVLVALYSAWRYKRYLEAQSENDESQQPLLA